jgi:hypothetical protein
LGGPARPAYPGLQRLGLVINAFRHMHLKGP